MRLAYYAGASTAAAAACLLKAFHERPNFYSATVYLSQSNACLLILTNLLLVLSCSFMYGLQRLLYGPLRPIEIEQLSEKAWYAVLDTLLAMPSFREDVGGWLLAMFTLLLAGKVWGWIGEGKVDVLEQQPPANPRLFHARLATSLLVSVAFDLWMLDYCVETVMADPRPGMMVIFTFEFAILSVSSTFTLSRYFLSLVQTRIEKQQMKKAIDERKDEIRAERAAARQNETEEGQPAPASPPNEESIEVDENEVDVPGWEEKRRYLFALEVFTDFVKLMIYIVFFTVSITFNGLPMHIMRDVYMTFASFSKRVADYVAYRKATSDMNIRYPDATTEEIRGDACIVCRETMVAWEQPEAQGQAQPADQQPGAAPAPARRRDEGLRAKKLPCGHILHLRCLKAWLERQQVCPTCRRPVVVAPEPTAPGQQPAVGANNQAAPRQQPQHPVQRPGRARFFNLGPLRIGFLNGPGDQIGNIIRQLQNPQAPPAAGPGQNGVQPAAIQQGPNHLGLQVPYANEQQGTQSVGTLAQVPTQVRMRQLEQRLMQDAHNLGVEQQQLSTLQAMENELARLRALHQPPQQGTGNAQLPLNANINVHIPNMTMHIGGHMPMQPMMPYQQPYIPPAVQQAFHGTATMQYGTGNANLPEGLVLPEGWTAMPLYRTDGGAATPGMHVEPVEALNAQSQGSQPNGTVDPTTVDRTATSGEQTSTSNNAAGPTDDNGSPLFVPTQPAVSSESVQSADISSQPAVSSSEGKAATAQSSDDRKAPWASEGWSFVDPPNGHGHENEEHHEQAASAVPNVSNGTPVGENQNQHSYEGKGKGRAVEVEDAPDEGI